MLTAALLQSVTDKLRGIIPCLVAARTLPKLPGGQLPGQSPCKGLDVSEDLCGLTPVEMPGRGVWGSCAWGSEVVVQSLSRV